MGNNKIEEISSDDCTFARLNSVYKYDLSNLSEYDGLIINASQVLPTKALVRDIRSAEDPSIYLMPIFLYKISGGDIGIVEEVTDGKVEGLSKLSGIAESSRFINQRVASQQEQKGEVSAAGFMMRKLLRFMVSRGQDSLVPIPAREAKLGYHYSILSLMMEFENEQEALDILDAAEEADLLTATFFEGEYVCNICDNSLMHFRETCPSCESSNIQKEDMVHHFRCAYVGGVSEFYHDENSRKMICPKCNKELKHIGVDYEKPSLIYTCRNCDHRFQDPIVKAKCNICESDNKVEHLIKKNLKTYQLTEAAKMVAEGKVPLDITLKRKLSDIIREEYFLHFLDKEIARKDEAEFDSCIATLIFDNMGQLFEKIGREDIAKILHDLYSEITATVHESDEVAFKDRKTALILFTEKGCDSSEELVLEVINSIKSRISERFSDFGMEISYMLAPVRADKRAESQMEDLLKSKNG